MSPESEAWVEDVLGQARRTSKHAKVGGPGRECAAGREPKQRSVSDMGTARLNMRTFLFSSFLFFFFFFFSPFFLFFLLFLLLPVYSTLTCLLVYLFTRFFLPATAFFFLIGISESVGRFWVPGRCRFGVGVGAALDTIHEIPRSVACLLACLPAGCVCVCFCFCLSGL
ncbi:hypothetical protein VTN02DRAFT_1017 [Thermoascus thermophilus]